MASRRPTIRSYSGNGRSGSQNGDSAPSPRLDSRNYLSNVRPENRSTFCSVMSQLTEETQPCFETTIKSKAVSEACNVKFTCVVTGYPVPELTWYKDDMELDRYCGLPKYEIYRNGKNHTLHIYNCSVDDAAIYQASARNSKGIVSCSGVLEVGTMSEYKIHQRFFAKLKQKAELKQRELEKSQRKEKESVQHLQLGATQDHTLKKLRLPDHISPFVQDGEDNNLKHVETILQEPNDFDEFNGLAVKANTSQIRSDISEENITEQMGSVIGHRNHGQQLDHFSENTEIGGIILTKEKVSKKEIPICNGIDKTNQSSQGAGGLKDTYEGMGLAKFLVESSQFQTQEEKQKNTIQSHEFINTDTSNVPERERENMTVSLREQNKEDIFQEQGICSEREEIKQEQETQWKKEQKKSKEREQENRKQTEHKHRVTTVGDEKTIAHKDADHQHKSALTSVFHSLKDIFFGKSKKIPETTHCLEKISDTNIAKEIPVTNQEEQLHLSEKKSQVPKCTPGVNDELSGSSETNVVDQHHQTEDLHVNKKVAPETPLLLHVNSGLMNVNLDAQTHEFTADNREQITQAIEIYKSLDGKEVNKSQENGEIKRVEEEAGVQSLPKIPLFKATDDHTETDRDEGMLDLSHETSGKECSAGMDQITQAGKEMHAVKERDTPYFIESPAICLPEPNRTELEGTESCHEAQLSQPNSHVSPLVLSKFEKMEENSKDKIRKECTSHTNDIWEPAVEEAARENRLETQDKGFLIDESEDKITVGTLLTQKSQNTEAVDMMEKLSVSLFDKAQECNTNFQEGLTPELNMNQAVTPQHENIIEIDLQQNVKSPVPVLVISFVENEQEVGTVSVGNDKSAFHNTSTVENMGKSTEMKKDDSTEVKKEQHENTEDNERKKKNCIVGNPKITLEQVSLNHSVKPGFVKNKKNTENVAIDAQSSTRQTKPKIHIKTQPESPQMIILPDTKETVIKNVAKMRAVPLTPEIKVTMPEKVKHEEPNNAPTPDVFSSETEKVHETAYVIGDNELQSKYPISDDKKASNETAKDGNIVSTAKPLTPIQQEMNVVTAHLDQCKQEVTSQNLESVVRDTEETPKDSGYSRGNDTNIIPIINIACADDVTQQVHGKSDVPVHLDSVTCSSNPTAYAQSTEKVSLTRELAPDTLAIMLRKAVSNIDGESSPNTNNGLEKAVLQTEQNVSERNLVGSQLVTEVSTPLLSKELNITQTDIAMVCPDKELKSEPDVDRLQRDKPAMEKLCLTTPVGPMLPPLSPASLRRLMAKNNPNLESQSSLPTVSGDGSEKKGEDSGGSTPTSILSCESSPKMKRRDSLTLIPSATPEELASGARRKIYLAKAKSEDEASDSQSKRDMSPSQARRAAFLQLQSGQQTPPMEKRSPLLGRRKNTLEIPKAKEEASEEVDRSSTEKKTAEKEKLDPYKAPQVIRKIRAEPFSDALGHLKLWCQFFNVLSDSTIKWFKDEVQIAEMKRSAGDESLVALAIVQASSRDCGVYGCSINNEYGTDSTDILLSTEILSEFFLRDDIEVGEEIELTPLLYTKGLAESGYWGDKFFGRTMTEEVQLGEGCTHKNSRVKVIYGLDPVFESGSTCMVKVKNLVVYGTKEENSLAERNLAITKQECKIQNTVREYCKIFAAEARVSDTFGFSLEVIPLYLMYRPSNTIPYATAEAILKGVYLKYSLIDSTGKLFIRTTSEVEQKCCTFQHWILQWTNGNLLVTQLEGVDTQITNIRIASKSQGYQGLTEEGSPKILEQFVSQHQCNYYCGLLGLRPLTSMDSLQQPKVKTSKSPLLARRVGLAGSPNHQFQKKGSSSPQAGRKGNSSPKVVKKTSEVAENKPAYET